jgi:outer membrane protein, adhesin transport system
MLMTHEKKRTKNSCLAMLVAGLLGVQHASHAQTIVEAVDEALRTNPQVLEAYNNQLAADQQVKQAQAGYYPSVTLDAAVGTERSDNPSTLFASKSLTRRESGIAASQMLFDGFDVKSQVDSSRALARSAAEQTVGAQEGIGLRAVEVYLDVLRQQELLDKAQVQLDTHERIYTRIKARADAGVGNRSDLEQAQARLSLAKATLVDAQGKSRDAAFMFARIVGHAPVNLVKPDDICCSSLPPTREAAVDIAYRHHPDVLAALAAYEADVANIQGAKARLAPKLALDAGVRRDQNIAGLPGRDDKDYAMLRLQQHTSLGGADLGRINEEQHVALASEQKVRSLKRQVEEATRLYWNKLESAQKRLKSLKQHVESAALTRDAYGKQFEIGERTLLDLLDGEAELFTAQSDYINGQYEERLARYQLLAEMGMLIETLGVKAPSAVSAK